LSFVQAMAESFGSSSCTGRKKGTDQPVHNSQGSGKEPIPSQFGADEGSGDGVTNSQAGNHVSYSRVAKA
jgi:hypothetical protein